MIFPKTCPTSNIHVDENNIRIGSFLILILLFISYFFPYLFLFLSIDFIMRFFGQFRFSLISIIAKKINASLKNTPKPIDFAPKKFTAFLGFLFSSSLLVLYLIKIHSIFLIVFLLFIIAVIGESFFGFCIGCKIYSFFIFLKKEKNDILKG